ncbi:hypothetical protein LTR09_002995 [Extremus antarcticus]|uniref:Uncharacterized protein n=1 Tax=Extremus antarcticus TaxID=702011 RepID=A0AAJ0GE38_9PEZI|nr:hypothetical protein LTR09_002995 [Extremus antarcticus]
MAPPEDSEIEKVLRRIVRRASDKNEDITFRRIREQAEIALDLDDGFFKNDDAWKGRSKDIITTAVEEEESKPRTPKPKSKEPAVKAAQASVKPSKEESRSQKKARKTAEVSGSSKKGDGNTKPRDRPQKTPQPPPKTPDHQVNGVKRKASSQSSSDDSITSESESDEAPEKKRARTSSGSSSQSSSEALPDNPFKTRAAPTPAATPGKVTSTSVQTIAPQTFHPPSGFTPLSSTQLQDLTRHAISSSSLEGKQIWHITAPSNVPLSTISELPLDALDSEQPILTHDGFDYSFSEDKQPTANAAALMIPTAEGYKRLPQTINRTIQLKQKITLPDLSTKQASQVTGINAAASIALAPVRGVRPQPTGLRMRYRPPGYGPGRLGAVGSGSESAESDEDEEPKWGQPAFQFPKALGAHSTAKRDVGKVDVDMVDADVERSPKQAKTQRRKEKHKEAAATAAPKVNGIGAADRSRATVKAEQIRIKKEQAEHSDVDSDIAPWHSLESKTNGVLAPSSNSGDKALRRAEKAQRKEERRLKRERKEAKQRAKAATAAYAGST